MHLNPAAGPILTSAEIRSIERQYLAAGAPLMERAGQAASEVALRILEGRSGCVLILAGPGNNGGDGFVVARLLREAGREVVVVCTVEAEQMPADARAARLAWQQAGGQVVPDFLGSNWALVVDAIFGIGLKRAPEGRYAEWIARLNQLSSPVLSLDLPSGLDADTGRAPGVAVRASHTVSFIAWKPGLLTHDGSELCGELMLNTLDLSVADSGAQVLTVAGFAPRLKPRASNSHKGSFGQAGVIGGAVGMVGAALLSARSALLLGAGRVYVGLLDPLAPMLDIVQPELMLRPPGDLHLICSALAIGPGLGQSEAAVLQMKRALGFTGPLVLDADALNLIAASSNLQPRLTQRDAPSVLTPHPAEAARLLQCAPSEVQADRLAACRELSRRYRAHVVLKGAGSIVCLADGRLFINVTGNAGLATAGSGDVLTGIVLALLAQGWEAELALSCGVYLHGAAADALLAAGIGPIGMTAGELAPAARRLLNAWVAERTGARG